ncbi:peptidase U32 family protein [Halobacillus sp. MO56]
MKKPELVVTPGNLGEIDILAEAGADAFIIGEQAFGLRLPGEFKKEQLREAVQLIHQYDKKAYVAVNGIFHNEKLEAMKDYVSFVESINADAIIFGDPAVLMTVREVAPNMKLHWSTETTGTNWYTANYWGRKGSKRAVLAKELNLDQVIEIKENAEVEIEVQVHGMTAMFQSKRLLVGNYFRYQGKAMEIERKGKGENLYLYDHERDNRYPIFEDENGTHIMSPNDVCMIDELYELIDSGIDALKIDFIFKSASYKKEVTALYRMAIDTYLKDESEYNKQAGEWQAKIENIQPKNRKLDTGFFFKETVY